MSNLRHTARRGTRPYNNTQRELRLRAASVVAALVPTNDIVSRCQARQQTPW